MLSLMLSLTSLVLLVPILRTQAAPALTPPLAGQYEPYNDQRGLVPPFPASATGAVLPSSHASPAPDDQLWQNLLSAEWIIYNFYQQGVEAFNETSFTTLGLPNTTYDRIQEIRDNEAGHLEIFYGQISNASIKPGPCKYEYGFDNAEDWLALQVNIEVSSMAFLTGLVETAATAATAGALTAVSQVETRHNTWALEEVWNTNPFSGPSDTLYPYPNQILQLTNNFVIDGSCPTGNPPYPTPKQELPYMDFNSSISSGLAGEPIQFTFPKAQPNFDSGKNYYAVFMHGLYNITQPFDVISRRSTIPREFDQGRGIIAVVIADAVGAPTAESVAAGPLIIIEQPQYLAASS